MVNFCAIYRCSNREIDKSYYRSPEIPVKSDDSTRNLSVQRRLLWISRINRKDVDFSPSHHRVCSDHFISGGCSKSFFDISNNCFYMKYTIS